MGQKRLVDPDIVHHLDRIIIMTVSAVGHRSAKQNDGNVHFLPQHLRDGDRVRQHSDRHVLRQIFSHIIADQRRGDIDDVLVLDVLRRPPGDRQIVGLHFLDIDRIVRQIG